MSCLVVPPMPPYLIKAETASRRPLSRHPCPSAAAASSSQRCRRRLPLRCTARCFPSFHATVSCLVGFAIVSSCSLYFSRAKPRPVGPSSITSARSQFSRPWRRRPCQRRRQHSLSPFDLIRAVQIRSNGPDLTIPVRPAILQKSP